MKQNCRLFVELLGEWRRTILHARYDSRRKCSVGFRNRDRSRGIDRMRADAESSWHWCEQSVAAGKLQQFRFRFDAAALGCGHRRPPHDRFAAEPGSLRLSEASLAAAG